MQTLKNKIKQKVDDTYCTNELSYIHSATYRKEIHSKIEHLFKARKIEPAQYPVSFAYTTNIISDYGPSDPEEKLIFIDDMREGTLFDKQKFMTSRSVMNFDELFPTKVSPHLLNALFAYRAEDFSNSGVGTGEYGLLMLIDGAERQLGISGDIMIDNHSSIEVKGKTGRMASVHSHTDLMNGKLEEFCNMQGYATHNFNFKGFKMWENEGLSGEQIADIVFYSLKTIYKFNHADFSAPYDSVIDGKFDAQVWRRQQAKFEFDYYKRTHEFEFMTTINPSKMLIKNVETRNDINTTEYRIDLTYNQSQYGNVSAITLVRKDENAHHPIS